MAALKARYAQAMERLYLACVVVSGGALVVITLIIPLGVFMRYAMNSPLSWPEPAAILMMVLFSFVGAAAVYRANGHIAVEALVKSVGPGARRVLLWGVDACMVATCLFMVWYGGQLSYALWHQSIAEFPGLSVGLTYTPIPIGGAITLAFILERRWVGPPPETSVMYRDQPGAAE
jgi:TRAP-type C4-dicarboxylate transport system permease small subunit